MPVSRQHEQSVGWPDRPVLCIDEAGRGPWAGPVVAACICLPPDFDIAGLDDSKKLTEIKREALFAQLSTLPHATGQAEVGEIDALNILNATFLAMRRAADALVAQMGLKSPPHILVDGNRLPDWPYEASAIIGGDGVSAGIAAASVLAKVTRDRLMRELDAAHPGYGWASNKGYGAKAHRQGLAQFGVTPHHRRSFKPIADMLRVQNG